MAELELVGIHADGEHVVLVDEEGQRHRLVIDDALRAAVRRDRPHLEQLQSDSLRPREIQTLIRAGASAAEIAADSGMRLEQVRRYEGPAIAEREHVAARAQSVTIGREPGAPTLGDLVLDRLAARGVGSPHWDARRRGSEPWEVIARFVAGDREREATWQVDLAAGSVTALDDESRWLSETDLGSTEGPRRHLSAVRAARLYDVETDADVAPALAAVDAVIRDTRPTTLLPIEDDDAAPTATSAPAEAAGADRAGTHSGTHDGPNGGTNDGPDDGTDAADTEALLDELSTARGVRQPVHIDDDALAAEVAHETPALETPALWEEDPPAGAHTPASRPEEATDAVVLEPRNRRKSAKNRRTSVPSWDEIVFGARND